MNNISQFPSKTIVDALIGNKAPILVPGNYEAEYFGAQIKFMFRTPKLYLAFNVKTGDLMDSMIYKYYNLKKVIDDVDSMNFQFGIKSAFYRDYIRLFGEPNRPMTSKEYLEAFENKIFLCRVVSVESDSEGEELSSETRYSKIKRIEMVTSACT